MSRNKTETPYAASRGARAQGCPLIGAHRLVNLDYQVAGGLFVDNLLVFGEDEQSVNTALRGAVGDLNDSGLMVGEVAWASLEAVYVGLELTQQGMTPKPHQVALLYNTTKYFASFQKLSGKVLRVVDCGAPFFSNFSLE